MAHKQGRKTLDHSEVILVKGKVERGAKRFCVSLGLDPSNLLICFQLDFTRDMVDFGYKKEGELIWGIAHSSCPFHEGEEVEITFTFEPTSSGTNVTVKSGDTQSQFENPMNLGYIEYIEVEGDFKLRSALVE